MTDASSAPADASAERPGYITQAIAALEHGGAIAATLERPDLEDRLRSAAEGLRTPDVTLVVVGEYKQGKSSLVNALLATDICPVDDDVSTVVPVLFRYGTTADATVLETPSTTVESESGDLSETAGTPPVRNPLPLDDIAGLVGEAGNPDNRRGITAVEVRLPRELLRSGLIVVDTPGVGGLASVSGSATGAMLTAADVVVFVSDASQELTATEVAFLERAHRACPNVVCVVTKTDLHLDWRRIVEADRHHLGAVGEAIDTLAVSTELRLAATSRADGALDDESGYTALVDWLHRRVLDQRARLSVRAAGATLADVAAQLSSPLQAELTVLDDPANAGEVLDELGERQRRAKGLAAQASRWQQLLTDGSQDLAADVDHDLRRRLRDVVTEASARIDEVDPVATWDDLVAWVERSVAGAIRENTDLLVERTEELAGRVASLFDEDGRGAVMAPTIVVAEHEAVADRLLELDTSSGSKLGAAITAMRGSYGGLIMFGMVAQLAGLALLNPFTVVVGLGMGRRALSEERKRTRAANRQRAKQAITRYVDQASFLAAKDSKDLVRRVQRDLRDTYRARAREFEECATTALEAATAAAGQDGGASDSRTSLRVALRNVERMAANARTLQNLPVEGVG